MNPSNSSNVPTRTSLVLRGLVGIASGMIGFPVRYLLDLSFGCLPECSETRSRVLGEVTFWVTLPVVLWIVWKVFVIPLRRYRFREQSKRAKRR
jgi:hypothetical protein